MACSWVGWRLNQCSLWLQSGSILRSLSRLLSCCCVCVRVQLTAPSQLGRRSDMDPNGHINNVAYLAWALEVIPEYICQDYQLTEVRGTHILGWVTERGSKQ